MADETRLHFDITGDNQSLVNSLRDAQKAMAGVIGQMENGGKQVTSEMNEMADSIENTFKRIAQAAGGVFAVSKAREIVSEIIDVRKEFQSLELSFATLTGDANKGKKLFADITQFATTTPMLEKDLAKGAQTLLGFNIEAEKIMPILKQIGDISMGDSQKFESLTLSFAQASSTGKLMGQDLLQMINAGFNPLVEISRTTGKSISELKDDMSAGKIGVEMLQNAFKTATEEGGKFHGMLNGMANGLEGSFSNLEGAIQKLFNDLGQEIEGPIVEGANLATASLNGLAENLETVGLIIEGLVATYGTYKAACLAATAVEALQALGIGALTKAEIAHYAWLLLVQKAQAALNAVMAINPYVAAATAIAAVAAGLYVFANRATGAEQAQKGLNDAIAEQKQVEEDRNAAVQKAISLATDESKANSERAQGIQSLVAEYGPIIQKYIDEEGHLTNIIALKKEIALLDGKKSVSALQGQSKQNEEYARLVGLALKGRGSMSKADNAALDKAMEQYNAKTGGGKYDYSRAKQYFTSIAKGTAKQAGTAATQANVNSFAEGIGAMDNKQLQAWQKRLKNAQALAKSGSLVNIQGITKGATSDQINGLLTQIEGTLNARNNKKTDDKKKKKSGKDSSVTNELEKQAAAREKLQEELTALERKNQEDENNTLEEGLDKKLAILKSAHEEEIEELQKQAADWARENKKAKMSGATASASLGGASYSGLTAAQVAALQNGQSVSDKAYGKAVKEARKQLVQSQIDYLKGSKNIYEQHEGNLMGLQNQRSQIDPNDTYALAANQREIDAEDSRFADELAKLETGFEEAWQSFEQLSDVALSNLEAQLRDAVENGINGKKVSAELAKELQGKIDQIRVQKREITWDNSPLGKTFGKNGVLGGSWLGNLVQMGRDKKIAQEDYNAKKQANEDAKNKLQEAEKKGKDSKEYQDARKKQNETQKDEDTAKGALDSAIDTFKTGGVGAIVNGVNANAQSLAEASKKLFGEGSDVAEAMGHFADASQGVSDAFSSLTQGDFIGALLGVGNAFSSLGEMFGFWSNSNFDEWQDTNEELVTANESLAASMDALTKAMEKQTASQSYETMQAQQAILQQQQQNAINSMLNNSELYDGGHSLRYDFNEGKNLDNENQGTDAVAAVWQNLYRITQDAKYLNLEKNGNTDLGSFISNLDANDAQKLLADSAGSAAWTTLMQMIQKSGDSGNYGAQGSLTTEITDFVTTYANANQEIEDNWEETVTGMSFDSLKDNFISMMMDLNSEVDDFADNFNEQLTQSIMSDVVSDKFGSQIESLQTKWANLIKERGSMSDSEYQRQLTNLQNEEANMSAQMIAERNAIAAATGYDDNESQKATRSSIENITQDQADQLIGRITAIQIAVEANNASMQSQSQNALNSYNVLMSMNNSMSLANSNLSDILMQHVQSNSYLADIVKYQRGIYEEMEGRIEKMSNKLDTL